MRNSKKLLAMFLALVMMIIMVTVPISSATDESDSTTYVEETVEVTDTEETEEESTASTLTGFTDAIGGIISAVDSANQSYIESVFEIVKYVLNFLMSLIQNFWGSGTDAEVDVEDDEIIDVDGLTITFELLLVEELVNNYDMFASIDIQAGDFLTQPEDPESTAANFLGWFTSIEYSTEFDFTQAVTTDTYIYAKWEINETDTDGDGLYDSSETLIGTNVNLVDTDGDGLSDYIEVEIGTDPLKQDSDDNGIYDYYEDTDNDSLINGDEVYQYKTSALYEDSDFDGLNDGSEINIYGTNPLEEDTDKDGATDLWEITNSFDPTIYNDSFEIQVSSEEVSDLNPVSASVIIESDGENVDSLSVKSVTASSNIFVSSSVAGYLGYAYDFTFDGEITSATLVFEYDESLYGQEDEDFQPRIYYFNEETQLFEELENQTVSNGVVIAETSHFSTYILLNKVEYDEIWETEIKPPEYADDDTKNGLDIVIAIDSSGSMGSNDSSGLRLEAAKAFVSELGIDDRAAIVDFDSSATVLCDLTSDIDLLNVAIDKVNSSGGTSLSVAVSKGIELLTTDDSSENRYKFIILLTDGDGSYSTYYNDLAVENDIQIYTIGLGSGVDDDLLQEIADATGGKYYFASEAEELLTVFENTFSETVDYVTDSNDDGISDYYSQLIYNGELPGAENFKGVDFDASDDYDKDGLKNGEEIQIVTSGTKVYLYMYSNPTLTDSDGDSYDDYTEVYIKNSDPLKENISYLEANVFTADSVYTTDLCANNLTSFWGSAVIGVNSLLYGVWNKDELYRDIMIDYFSNYDTEDSIDDTALINKCDYIMDALYDVVNWIGSLKSNTTGLIDDIFSLIDAVNGVTTELELTLIIENYEYVFEQVYVIFPDSVLVLKTESISYSFSSYDISGTMKQISTGISVAVTIVDVLDTIDSFATVSANNETFQNNIDILNKIINTSDDDHAKDAAYDIKQQLVGDYAEAVIAVAADVGEFASKYFIGQLAKSNPYILAVTATISIFDVIVGISKTVKEMYQLLTYYEMINATNILFSNNLVSTESSMYLINNYNDSIRYVKHLAQLRILGELKAIDVYKNDGLLGLFDNVDDLKEIVYYNISTIKSTCEKLNITISSSL